MLELASPPPMVRRFSQNGWWLVVAAAGREGLVLASVTVKLLSSRYHALRSFHFRIQDYFTSRKQINSSPMPKKDKTGHSTTPVY